MQLLANNRGRCLLLLIVDLNLVAEPMFISSLSSTNQIRQYLIARRIFGLVSKASHYLLGVPLG